MATIQEMQKARELMKTWLDLKTAVAQARTPVTPTSQINQDRLAQNQASRQANPVTPVTPTHPAPITPAPIVNAPVDQTTGLSKPLEPAVQPAPIPTPAQPVANPKVDTTPWITQDAFQQAKAESEKIKAQNDAVMAQNQQKAELARQDEAMKAEALIPKDEKWVLNALISGASVPKQNTQAYRNAEFKANNFRKFNSMTPTQLLDNLKQGQISSEMDQLLSQNPNYTQAKQKLNEQQKITNLNKTMNNIVNWVKWKEVETTTPEQDEEDISIKLMQKYGLDDANAQAFSQFVATDEEMADNKAKLLANRNQLSSVNRQIADATKLFNDWVSQLKKDYPNISASAIITLMWSRLGEFNDAITNLNSTKTLLQADIKDEMELAKSAFDARSEDIKAQNQIRQSMALNEYKADFEKQQAEQALNDPATQIKATMDEFEKMGITSQGYLASKIAEFKTSGLSLPEYVNNLRKLYMAKPEYQRIQTINQGKLSDIEKFQMQNAVEDRRNLRNFAQQKELALLNKDLTRQQFLFELENDPEKKAKALELEQKLNSNKSLFDVLGKNVGTYEGNRGYDLAGNLGDPLPAGGNWTVKSVDTAGEQVGSIFIGGKGKKPYGNTVVMQDENGNEIRYSHLQNIGVKPWDILGFGDIVGTRGNTGNVKGANGETLTAEQLKAGRWAHVDIEIKSKWADGKLKLLSNSEQVNFLKGLKAGGDQPLADQKFTQFNQTTSKFYSNPQVKAFEDALNAGGDMIASLKSANWPWDVGAVFSFMKSLDPASVVKEWEFKLARESGWLDAKFDNLYGKIINGEQLTDEQRKAFGKISFEYIKSKWRMYDSKYNDMVKVLKNQWIPESYYPTRMTDYIKQYENGWSWIQNTGATQENTTLSITPEQKSKFDALYSRIQK